MLAKGKTNVNRINEVLEGALQATTQERQTAVSNQLTSLVEDTNGEVQNAKKALEELKRTSEEEDQREASADKVKPREIRANMQNQLAKKHRQLLVDFQKAQLDYKQALEQRQAREMMMMLPDATQEEVKDMIEHGETSSLLVARKMAGTHALLIDEVNRIKEKHQDILRLERSMADLNQMFQEMAVLVDSQGEMLDAIEVHVHQAKVYTAKAEENLITTRKVQHSTQKWICCIVVVLIIVLIAILLPVITQQ